MRMLANTGENIEDFPSVGPGVLRAVRGQDRQSLRPRKIDKFPRDPFLAANEMPLNFDEDVLPPESVNQNPRAIFQILGSAGCQPAASGSLPDATSPPARRFVNCLRQAAANNRLAACAPQKYNQSLRKLRQFTPLHRAFAFFAAQMRLRQQ